MADAKQPMRYTLALALGSSFTLVALFGTGLVGVVVWLGVSHLLRDELQHRLSHASGVAALDVDAAEHGRLQRPEDEASDYYKELRTRLQLAQSQSEDVAYVYTVRLVDKGGRVWAPDEEGHLRPRPAGAAGEVVFVVDADPEPDSGGRIGQVYNDAPALLMEVLRGTATLNEYGAYVSEDFYTDQWGTFLSGYIPIRGEDGGTAAVLCTDISAAAVLAREREAKLIILALCAFVALITVPIGLVFARWIRKPLLQVGREMDRIATLDLDHGETITSRIIEVNLMGRELDHMKTGLRSFRKYAPARLVRKLLEMGVVAELGGAREEVSIFFSDIAGFTAISESLSPEELVELLGEYLSTITDILLRHDATVDKYIGDSVMAFWNAPVRLDDHAHLACVAALDVSKSIEALNRRWQDERRGVSFETRIGVHTGDVIVGNMGSEQRLAYMIMGDTVNLASRLEGANKVYRTGVLISGATYERVEDRVVVRRVDRVAVKGKSVPTDFYELIGVQGDVSPATLERITEYQRGFELYVSRRFSDAAESLERVLKLDPEDGPAQVLRARCLEYESSPPPEGWDGSHVLTDK